MAATKTILKKTTHEVVVRIIATADGDTSTITLATDCKMPNETLKGTQKVYITAVHHNTANDIKVVRGGVTVGHYFFSDSWLDSKWAIVDQAASDLVVTFSGPGMLIVQLKKADGYNTPIEDASFGSYDNPTVVGS
jgi:hypothetical protein